MRRFVTWLGLAAGALAFWRWRHRRTQPAPSPEADPAEDLKRKLAESRTEEPSAAPEPVSETPRASVDERRRAVHDRGRRAIDDMLGGENLPGEESHE
jgi:hypothetical protein